MDGSWGALGVALLHFKQFWASPPSLGGVFWGVSGRFWGRSGRNLDQQTFWGLIFGICGPFGSVFLMFFVAYSGRRRRCLLYWFRLAVCADFPSVVALISRVAKMADTRCVP